MSLRAGPQRSLTVMVVEDHDLMRETLIEVIDRMPGFEVCAGVASGEAALAAPACRRADIVLVDMSLPGMTGAEFVAEVLRRRPSVVCVMLSGHREPHYVERAFDAGARGYVVKGRPAEIEVALRTVADGEQYRSPSLG